MDIFSDGVNLPKILPFQTATNNGDNTHRQAFTEPRTVHHNAQENRSVHQEY